MPQTSSTPFTPVPTRARHDGWTPERQRGFVDRLAAGCSPAAAAQQVGMSRQTAYALRARPGAAAFRAAWDAAVAAAAAARITALRGDRPTRFARAVTGDDRALLALLRAAARRGAFASPAELTATAQQIDANPYP